VTDAWSTGTAVSSGTNFWTPSDTGNYCYLFDVCRGGELLGTIDSSAGVGKSTSWNVINAADRNSIEMQVGW
jgi:hypothetical protein